MRKAFVDEHTTWVFAGSLAFVVLLMWFISETGAIARFVAGHEFRPLQALLAQFNMALMKGTMVIVIALCVSFLFVPVEGKWKPNQLVFLVIAALAVWRLVIMHRLLAGAP